MHNGEGEFFIEPFGSVRSMMGHCQLSRKGRPETFFDEGLNDHNGIDGRAGATLKVSRCHRVDQAIVGAKVRWHHKDEDSVRTA